MGPAQAGAPRPAPPRPERPAVHPRSARPAAPARRARGHRSDRPGVARRAAPRRDDRARRAAPVDRGARGRARGGDRRRPRADPAHQPGRGRPRLAAAPCRPEPAADRGAPRDLARPRQQAARGGDALPRAAPGHRVRARLANQPLGEVLDGALDDVLAEIEASPRGAWPKLLRLRFPNDPSLVKQALIWLHAGRGDDLPGTMPSLGEGGDRFELAVVLDSGATASVWKAYDRKLGRHVAIKVFHARASSMIQQSLAEARASSEVISEHVVRVHDVHDADPPYLVLALVGEHEPGGA